MGGSLDTVASTLILALVGVGVGLALAPVNNAALAQAPDEAHGTISALVVVARMVGMVVGLALLTAIGLHQYYDAVAQIPDRTDTAALVDAAIVQVHWVFRGAGVAAAVGALVALGPACAAIPCVRLRRAHGDGSRGRNGRGVHRAVHELDDRVGDRRGRLIGQHVAEVGQDREPRSGDLLLQHPRPGDRGESVLGADEDVGRHVDEVGE